MNRTDATFLKHFIQLIAAMVGVTLVLIIIALIAHKRFYGAEQPAEITENSRPTERQRFANYSAQTEARTRPVGQFLAGEAGVARKRALEEAAAKAAQAACAYDCTQDGAVVYARLCAACHEAGTGGTPKLVHSDWSSRINQGFDTLVDHAINGLDGAADIAMPARGGNPSLTDEQIRITVQYMVDNLK